MSIPEVRFKAYLLEWAQILAHHEFIVEVRTIPLKKGGVRRKADAIGYDVNEYVLDPKPFPATFVRYITEHLPGIKQDENTTTYQLDFGMLMPTFLRYRRVAERNEKIEKLLK